MRAANPAVKELASVAAEPRKWYAGASDGALGTDNAGGAGVARAPKLTPRATAAAKPPLTTEAAAWEVAEPVAPRPS